MAALPLAFLALDPGALIALSLRVIGVTLSGALLFALLREEKPTRLTDLRAVGFTLLGALMFWAVTAPKPAPAAIGPGTPLTSPGFQAAAGAKMMLRYSLVQEWAQEQSAVQKLSIDQSRRQALKALPAPPGQAETLRAARLRAVILGTMSEWEQGRQAILGSLEAPSDRDPEVVAAERHLWEQLYADDPPTPSTIAEHEATLDELKMGWLADVLRLTAYRRAGDQAAVDEISARVYASAMRALLPIGIFIAALLLISLLAFGLGATALALRLQGKLPTLPQDWRPVSPPLVEGLMLMMLLLSSPIAAWLADSLGDLANGGAVGSLAGALFATGTLQAVALVYLAVRLRARGATLAEIGFHGRDLRKNILYGVAGWVMVFPLVLIVAYCSARFGSQLLPDAPPPTHPVINLLAEDRNVWFVALVVFAGAVVAPIFEEIFFRGGLYGAIRRKWGVWPGLLLSSTVFAAIHPQGPLGFLPLFTLAAAFCLLYEWRKSLVPGIVAHAVNNGFAFLMLLTLAPSLE